MTTGSCVCVPDGPGHVEGADRRAVSSARKLEQRRPAEERSSVVVPSGHSMYAPAPPFRTPPSADPSVYTHVARWGREARCCWAARRAASAEVSCWRGAPMDRLKLTWGHAGHLPWGGGLGRVTAVRSGGGGDPGGLPGLAADLPPARHRLESVGGVRLCDCPQGVPLGHSVRLGQETRKSPDGVRLQAPGAPRWEVLWPQGPPRPGLQPDAEHQTDSNRALSARVLMAAPAATSPSPCFLAGPDGQRGPDCPEVFFCRLHIFHDSCEGFGCLRLSLGPRRPSTLGSPKTPARHTHPLRPPPLGYVPDPDGGDLKLSSRRS